MEIFEILCVWIENKKKKCIVMDQPLFSILIANYNNGRFLQEAIDSVLEQTYPNWEVIIVDDKSTDNSFEIYEKYKDDGRFHIYYNEKNMGCGYTKRRCAELANGEICGFLDPDDTLLAGALEKHAEVHSNRPNVSVVYSRCYLCNPIGEVVGESCLLELKEGETYFDYRWYGAMNLASYKNAYYKRTTGISSKNKAGVDQDLYFKIEEVGDICVLNEFTYKYYQRNENAITNNIGSMWYWNMEVRRDACIRRGLDAEKILCDDWNFLLNCMLKDGEYRKAEAIRSSYAYRLGKVLLKPFSWIRKTITK